MLSGTVRAGLRSFASNRNFGGLAMNNGNKSGFEGRGAPGSMGDDTSLSRSQTGRDTQGRSPDYDDDRLGDDRLIDGRHATDLKSDGTGPIAAPASSTGHHHMGENVDGMGRDRTDQVTADETGKLISAEKVIGTAVYNANGDRLGTIYSVMLHKISGRVAYAVMSFGGFLGIGERYHPLPWDVLTYDEEKGGYNIDKTEEQLRGAPHYSREELDSLDYGQTGSQIRDYYGVGSSMRNSTSTSSAYASSSDAGGSSQTRY